MLVCRINARIDLIRSTCKFLTGRETLRVQELKIFFGIAI